MTRNIPFVEKFIPSGDGRVLVYRNLNKRRDDNRPVWSVRDAASGLVIAHTLTIELSDVKFKVSEAGNARVRREKRKTVHAFVTGVPVTITDDALPNSAYYNPYVTTSFIDAESKTPLSEVSRARVDSSGVHYAPHND